MVDESKILDAHDNLNSIIFCLENKVGDTEVKKSDIEESINSMKKAVIDDLNSMKTLKNFNEINNDRLRRAIKGKLSLRTSLLYKADILLNLMKIEEDDIKVSKNIVKYLGNDI